MTKEKLAIEVIKRLKPHILAPIALLSTTRPGSSSYQSGSQPSALMPA